VEVRVGPEYREMLLKLAEAQATVLTPFEVQRSVDNLRTEARKLLHLLADTDRGCCGRMSTRGRFERCSGCPLEGSSAEVADSQFQLFVRMKALYASVRLGGSGSVWTSPLAADVLVWAGPGEPVKLPSGAKLAVAQSVDEVMALLTRHVAALLVQADFPGGSDDRG
jgi:hypothetical protein